ncbi:MAG: CPBP family intramembrane metalloprotease [Clostridia bacterium]|nr:CPBP family intramembrane metalloprotease [Clostridia bacterium]
MHNHTKQKIQNIVQVVCIVALCLASIILEFIKISYLKDGLRNALLSKIIQQACGGAAAILIMVRLKIRLFNRPQKLLFLIPCFIIAIDNFQFFSFFSGNMKLINTHPLDVLLFIGYCLAVGLFEECIFRGILFSLLASWLPKNKKGFLWTYVLSSIVFGAAHILNGFSMGTLVQVGYTILTGGLFAFCLIKTKNILCCAAVHAVYNFCGLLMGTEGALGLGTGVVFDLGTVITMLVVSVLIGIFVLCKVFTYKDKERIELYKRLGIFAE